MPTTETLDFLRQVTAFSLLEDREVEQLAGQLQVEHYSVGRVVCRAGDSADSFYLVFSGRARVLSGSPDNETTVGTLSRGDHFGEQSLISGGTRAFTVRAADDLVLLRLSRDVFQATLERRPELARYFDRHFSDLATRNFIRLCSTFRVLKPEEVQGLLDCLEPQDFPAGATVFRQGDPGDRFHLIRSGRALVVLDGQEVRRLGEGEFFGELALVTGEPRTATILAETPLSTLTVSAERFRGLLEQFPKLRESIRSVAFRYVALPPQYAEFHGNLDTADGAPTTDGFVPPPALEAPSAQAAASAPADAPQPSLRATRRRPLIYQIGEMDCGAACLAMIGKFYGRDYRMQTVREMAQVGRDGASLRGLADAAERLGFRARPVRAELPGLARTTLPAIAHWGGNHYVVVYEANGRGVVLGDPARGVRRCSAAEFNKEWTGLALLVEPGDQLAPSEESPSLLQRFLPIVQPHWRILLEVLGCSLLLQMFGLAIPLFTQTVVDRVVVHRDVSMLNLMLAGMGVVVAFEVLTSALRQLLLIHAIRRIDVSLGVQFLAHVLRLPNRYFENTRVGDVVTRFSETENVRRLLTSTAVTVVLDMLTIVVYVGIMAAYNATLTLTVGGMLVVFTLLGLAVTPAFVRNLRATFEAYADAQSLLVETITGVQTVKSVCAERPVRWRWEEMLLKYIRLQFKGMNFRLLMDSIGTVMQMAVTTVLLWYGARLVMAGQLTIGQMMAFLALTGTLMGAVTRTIGVWDEIQEVRMSLLRLSDVLDTRPEEPHGAGMLPTMPVTNGHIRFERVTFRYGEQARSNALENIDLEILPGQTVALVGRSGCGKSTLVKLLLRLNEPTSGRIVVDGHDISKVNVGSWRRQVGAVLQESFLFSGTIRENIALGHPDATFEEVQRAGVMSGAHDFISDMPLGYNTRVGEQGMSLSGGQRQRINIARALLAQPQVLIMDEATSSLDTESERAIQRNMETVLRDRTILVIAHRLSTVRNADRIVVLDRGVIVEQGTHEELMSRHGLYFYLCSQQLDQ